MAGRFPSGGAEEAVMYALVRAVPACMVDRCKIMRLLVWGR